jgi:hypothetical protein
LVDHTEYFPGWRVWVDGNTVPIQFQDINYRGQITFSVNAGNHQIVMKWEEDKLRFISDMVSLITLIICMVVVGWRLSIIYAKKRI